ncbi:MAG: hypothetical protein LBI53_08190 [Candidatus Peribacteria bacterium]|nr:hypothetical protein [Candidatus Peribacteria bacterium]
MKDDIKVKEQAVFAAGKTLDAKLERISTIYSGLSQLTSGYDNVIALYKNGYNTINQKKEEIVSELKKIDKRIGEFKGNTFCIPTKEYHPEGWTELLSAMERFFKTESLICPNNADECDDPITITETLEINDFSKTEFKKLIETNPVIFSGENDEELISRSVRKFFDTIFKVNPADTLRLVQHPGEDIPEKIPGLNLLTPDRPIDSPRYTTFQGINAQEIKFIYPNLYKVEVFKT